MPDTIAGEPFSIFFTALCFAGAVSGLLFGAVISGLEKCTWEGGMALVRLYLIEDVLTIATAIGAIFVLPNYPRTTKWLNPDERVLLADRVLGHRQDDSAHPPRMFAAPEVVKAVSSHPRTQRVVEVTDVWNMLNMTATAAEVFSVAIEVLVNFGCGEAGRFVAEGVRINCELFKVVMTLLEIDVTVVEVHMLVVPSSEVLTRDMALESRPRLW
ncbi:hypothetical protein LTR49_028444 [Elasticomyces elasticus]|nr:hypothetical protein LTR49_028444 [Elasticomyces elasticus]